MAYLDNQGLTRLVEKTKKYVSDHALLLYRTVESTASDYGCYVRLPFDSKDGPMLKDYKLTYTLHMDPNASLDNPIPIPYIEEVQLWWGEYNLPNGRFHTTSIALPQKTYQLYIGSQTNTIQIFNFIHVELPVKDMNAENDILGWTGVSELDALYQYTNQYYEDVSISAKSNIGVSTIYITTQNGVNQIRIDIPDHTQETLKAAYPDLVVELIFYQIMNPVRPSISLPEIEWESYLSMDFCSNVTQMTITYPSDLEKRVDGMLPKSGGTMTGQLVVDASTGMKFSNKQGNSSGSITADSTIGMNAGGGVLTSFSTIFPHVNSPIAVHGLMSLYGNRIVWVADPDQDQDAATKKYVDTAIQTAIGNAIKEAY